MNEPIGNRRTFDRLPGGGYRLTLTDDAVAFEVRHLHRKDHHLTGEVDVKCDWAGVPTYAGSLSCAALNLSSQSARTALAKHCGVRANTKPDTFDWLRAIDELCLRTMRSEEEGADAIVLDDAADDGPPRNFRICGLDIPADSHSQLIADGDSLKSLLLLFILGEMARQGRPVLYLDFEWNAARHKARKRRLFGHDRIEHLYYLKCENPLTVEQDHIRRFCEQQRIQFLGLDSIGAAVDGKLADDDVARAYNRVLGHLPPSLAAGHVPKGTDPSAELKAFGSAFFHNFARQTWSVRKQTTDRDDDRVMVLLKPNKQNDGARLRPVGLAFKFSDARIDVAPMDPMTVDTFAADLPIAARMRHLLKNGPLTYAEIAEQLGEKRDSVIKAADRGKAFTKVTNMPDGIHRIALVERWTA